MSKGGAKEVFLNLIDISHFEKSADHASDNATAIHLSFIAPVRMGRWRCCLNSRKGFENMITVDSPFRNDPRMASVEHNHLSLQM